MFKLFRIFLLALTSLVSFNTSAATYNFGPVTTGVNVLGTHAVAAGVFSDIINFTLPGSASLGGSASSFQFNVGPISIFNITGLDMGLYNSSNTLLGNGLNFNVPGIQSAGAYYVKITGTATGMFGGLYSAGVNVSPTPEPETWAMMMGGLSLVAAVARRKKNASAPAIA